MNTIASGYKWVAETMNTTQVNAGCLAAHGGDLATCFLAEKTLPFVTSAVFATQDLVDSWQMYARAGLGGPLPMLSRRFRHPPTSRPPLTRQGKHL